MVGADNVIAAKVDNSEAISPGERDLSGGDACRLADGTRGGGHPLWPPPPGWLEFTDYTGPGYYGHGKPAPTTPPADAGAGD